MILLKELLALTILTKILISLTIEMVLLWLIQRCLQPTNEPLEDFALFQILQSSIFYKGQEILSQHIQNLHGLTIFHVKLRPLK